ncbi:MAG: hypothetical protein M3Q29_21895 [Chloroflexota bacterium]|nr:hypothetical protein [Chloroflexota bacterium]
MGQEPREQDFGPVGAPQEDLQGAPQYEGVLAASAEPGPSSPQVEPLPGEVREEADEDWRRGSQR